MLKGKYNIKSNRILKIKENSYIYGLWLREYGEKEATRLYHEFIYKTTHGQQQSYHTIKKNN